MERASVDGITLEYEVSGEGEPVIFIHGAFIADAFRPLVAEPTMNRGFKLITYRRRGYVGSTRTPGPVAVSQQAEDCRGLLQHLGVERAHVVGDSFGGCVGLQLALESPEVVHSLALLEPALMIGESGPSYRESLRRSEQLYRKVGAEAAVDEAFRARWPDYRSSLERALPGAFEQAIVDAPATFDMDIGLLDWRFGEEEARRVTQPTLSVLGANSEALWSRFGETHRLLLEWLPNAEAFVLPGATHFLQVQNPNDMAEALAAYFARHPLRRPMDADAHFAA